MPRQKIESDEKSVAVNIRLPESLKLKVQELATREGRSMVQEIRWLLQYAVRLREKELDEEEE